MLSKLLAVAGVLPHVYLGLDETQPTAWRLNALLVLSPPDTANRAQVP
jgi:hypothetical protein